MTRSEDSRRVRWLVLADCPALVYALSFVGGVYPAWTGLNASTSHGPGGSVSVLAIDPTAPTILHAGAAGGVIKSTDAGSTWDALSAGLANTDVNAQVSVCPHGVPRGAEVDVALIMEAVNNSLSGCGA